MLLEHAAMARMVPPPPPRDRELSGDPASLVSLKGLQDPCVWWRAG